MNPGQVLTVGGRRQARDTVPGLLGSVYLPDVKNLQPEEPG